MKKSVKILIVVLCLIIVGLAGFIVWDKIINNKKDDKNATNSSQNNVITNSNENVNTADSNNATQENGDEAKIANEAIKKALKDKEWIKSHIIPVMFNFEGAINKADELYNEHDFFFSKISNNNMPTYIVMAEKDYSIAVIVSYKNGSVCVSKQSIEFADMTEGGEQITADTENAIVRGQPDSYDTEYTIYSIKDGEFNPILNWVEEADLTRSHFYNSNKITGEQYSEKIEEYNVKYNFKKIENKLTDENIDKIVK